jgi:hypothetical protein
MTTPYRLPDLTNPPRVWSSCIRCDWMLADSNACEVRGLKKCYEVNPDGECDRWAPRRAWWRRFFGIGGAA